MLCIHCGTDNPETNNFCGTCGHVLVSEPVPVAAEPEEHHASISGPSFLGLAEDEPSDTSSYLLEDDQPRKSHAGWYIFATVAIGILAVIGWMEWQAIKTGQMPVPLLKTTSAGPANAPDQTSKSATSPSSQDSLTTSEDAKPTHGSDQSTAPPSAAANATEEKPSAGAVSSSTSSEKTNDQAETQVAESRLSKEAEQRRSDEVKNQSAKAEDEKNAPDEADEKAAPEAKAVAVTKPPDPRQNSLLLSGEKYLYGRGVPQSCQQALTYFRAAADGDNAPAMSHLGAMYASGHCVPINRTMAYKWFARASETDPRNQWTQRNLNMLWRDMTPQERAAVSSR